MNIQTKFKKENIEEQNIELFNRDSCMFSKTEKQQIPIIPTQYAQDHPVDACH